MKESTRSPDSESAMQKHMIASLDHQLVGLTMKQLAVSRKVAVKVVEREVDLAVKKLIVDL